MIITKNIGLLGGLEIIFFEIFRLIIDFYAFRLFFEEKEA
jgi:hypothetical protein